MAVWITEHINNNNIAFFPLYELVFNILIRFCKQLFCINCFGSFDVGYYTPVFSTYGSICTKSNAIVLMYIYESSIFSFKCVSVSVMVNVFSLFDNSDINYTLCFYFFVLSPWMLQLIIEYKLVCPRKLELDSSPPLCCSIVVVHCASLSIKKNTMVIRRCAPLCRSLVPILGIKVWGVGLRWDDDAGKCRIMCFVCEWSCLRRMKGLSRS